MSDWTATPCVSGGLGPRWAAVSSVLARTLRTSHQATYTCVARATAFGDEELTPDVPGRDSVDHLAPSGIAEVGTRVRPGQILVGKITPTAPRAVAPEAEYLRALFGDKAADVRDSSLRVPPGIRGTIVNAESTGPRAKGELARATVTVEWTRALSVGDALEIDGRDDVTVCAILPSVEGLVVEGIDEAVRVRRSGSAERTQHARSIGPYTIVSRQPVGGKARIGGQHVSEGLLRRLLGGGAAITVGECLTMKSDAVRARIRAYESLARGESPGLYAAAAPKKQPSGNTVAPDARRPVPEAARVLQAEATALGFEVEFEQGQGRARWLSPSLLLERSYGEVSEPKTIHYRTHEPEPDGLFCAKIFGPVRNYECSCGACRGTRDRGKVCETCGVEVTSSDVRRTRFGHIRLAAPLLHPWLAEPIARLLERTVAEVNETPGEALHAALSELDLAAVEKSEPPRGAIARALRESGQSAADLMITVVPVLPPGLRPLMPRPEGRFVTTDLNDLYIRLIKRNLRARSMAEMNSPDAIMKSEFRKLQEVYEALVRNADLPKKVTGPGSRTLRCLTASLAMRGPRQLMGKRADYSGVAALVVDPSLDEGACRLPRRMALELFRPHLYGALARAGYATSIKAAKPMVEDAADALAEGGELAPATGGPSQNPHAERPLDELALSVDSMNGLRRAGIETVSELARLSEVEVLKLGFKRRSFKELGAVLASLGLGFGMKDLVLGPRDMTPHVVEELGAMASGRPVLLADGDEVVSRSVTLWDHPAIAVSRATAETLVGRQVAVHVPLSEEAIQECRAFGDHAAPVPRTTSGWLSGLLLGTREPAGLAAAALSGDVDPLDDPLVRLALGFSPA